MEIGIQGSPMHILTNKNIPNKTECLKDILKENAKDTLVLGGITLGAAGTTALLTGTSKNALNAFNKLKGNIAEKLDSIVIKNGNILSDISLKDRIGSTKLFKKLNNLSPAAQAGILAGITALAIATPIINQIASNKASYIEGKHEIK